MLLRINFVCMFNAPQAMIPYIQHQKTFLDLISEQFNVCRWPIGSAAASHQCGPGPFPAGDLTPVPKVRRAFHLLSERVNHS